MKEDASHFTDLGIWKQIQAGSGQNASRARWHIKDKGSSKSVQSGGKALLLCARCVT